MHAASLSVIPTCGGQAKGVLTTGVSAVDTDTQSVSGVLGFGCMEQCARQHHPWMSRGVFFGQSAVLPAKSGFTIHLVPSRF